MVPIESILVSLQMYIHTIRAASMVASILHLIAGMELPYPDAKQKYHKHGNSALCQAKAENGNCFEETNYMMLHCPFECMGEMKDQHVNCNKWA